MWPADMIRNRLADARRFRTATAHSAYALYVVMPIPLGFASLKRSAVRMPTTREKHRRPYGLAVLFWSCWADSNCHSAYRLRDVHCDAFSARCARSKGRQFECRQHEKNTAGPTGLRCFSGAAGQIRTADLILTKDALYLLSYSSKVHAPRRGHVWRPRRDLNPRPPA